MPGEQRGDKRAAVDHAAHRAAHRGVVERSTAQVEAEVLHCRSRHVGGLHRAANGPRAGAGRIEAEEVDAAGGEPAQRGVVVLDRGKRDALERQRAALPMGICGQRRAVGCRCVDVGAGAERNEVILRAGLDDGNVQQGGEAAVCLRQRDDQRMRVLRLHRGDVRKARAVARGLRRAAVGREHVVRGEGRAVGKDCAAQREGPRQRLGVAAAAFAQHRLRRERSVEREERLVEQRADGLLHAVDAGHGVKGLAREIGQGEVGDLRRLALRFLLRRGGQVIVPEVVRLRLRLPAAGQREREDQRERERRQPPRHRASSVRTMTAAMPPRSPPMPRCDQ